MRIKYLITLLILFISLALSFTNFYSIGYLLAVIVPTILFGQLFIFRTYFQKFILFFLTFIAVIPLTGLICWATGVELHPIYNIAGLAVICTLLYNKIDHKLPSRTVDRADAIAVIVSLLPITLLIFSYATSPNQNASLFQLASEGWDNGSHILMLEDVSAKNGYVYGYYEDLKDTIIQESNAYPQAWHLATANFVNGFGGNRFNPQSPMATIFAYMIAVLVWLVLACYIFVLCSWRFYELLAGKKLEKMRYIIPLVSLNSLVFMVVFIASLMHGFTNYIGSLVYLMLLGAMAIELYKINSFDKNKRSILILAILYSTVSGLIWFLTLPAIGLMALMMLVKPTGKIKDGILEAFKEWRVVLFTVAGVAAVLLQVYIFQKFSTIGGESQLNVGSRIDPFDVLGSPLHISHILFGVIMAAFFAYLLSNKFTLKTKYLLLTLVAPWTILALGIYLYQNITAGFNSYYLTKTIGLCFVAVMIPLSALLVLSLTKIKNIPHPQLVLPAASVIVAIIAVYAAGQPTYGLNKLFQANARTTYSTSEQIIQSLPQTIDGDAYIVVLTDRKSYEGTREDHHGKLEIRVVHQPLNCTFEVTGYISVKEKVKRLSKCADELAKDNKKIIVITSSGTKAKVDALQKSNIIVRES